MRLSDLFFNRKLQHLIITDLEHDLGRFKSVAPGLIGTPATPSDTPIVHTTINGFFPGSQLEPIPEARCLCDNLDLDAVKSGPDWARVWCMLLLLLVSPRMIKSIVEEPGQEGVIQRLWVHGKPHGFRLEPFHDRMFRMMCGTSDGHNAMTPFEIVCRELTSFDRLNAPLPRAS